MKISGDIWKLAKLRITDKGRYYILGKTLNLLKAGLVSSIFFRTEK